MHTCFISHMPVLVLVLVSRELISVLVLALVVVLLQLVLTTTLAQTIAEKQATLERTIREKTAVEKELDKLYAEGVGSAEQLQDTSTSPSLVDQLTGRLETVERQRDDAINKRDSLLNQISRNDLLYATVPLAGADLRSGHLCSGRRSPCHMVLGGP